MAFTDRGLEDVVLRFPASLRERLEEMACRECLSMNLFVLTAIAEKIQRSQLQECLQITEREELRSPAHASLDALLH